MPSPSPETTTSYSTVEGDIQHWALFSGGHDSLVCTHYCMENGYANAVLHLDTNTGIDANEDYIKDICEQHGWPLRIEQAPITLKELALEVGSTEEPMGFPGPGHHRIAYRWLKEKQLRTIAKETDGKPHYWTGVRKNESEKRMRTVTDAVDECGQWFWHAPIRNWVDDRMDEYIDRQGLPRNPVAEKIHRSGECYCGAFGYRDEEIVDLQAHYPGQFEWIKEVEEDVIAEMGRDNDRAYWAHGNLSDSDLTHLKTLRDDDEMMLCRDCRDLNQNSGSEVDW